METGTILLILAATFALSIIIRVPVAFALFFSAIITAIIAGLDPLVIVQQFVVPFGNESLLAIFTFVALGVFMEKTGVARDLVEFLDNLVGHIHGGLGVASAIASMFYGTLTGSVTSTVAAIGAITVPEMKKRGYAGSFSVATVSSAGILGSLIPPSIVGIIYGFTTNTSIIGVFMATIGPAILYTTLLSIVIVFISRKRGYRGKEERESFREIFKHFARVLPTLCVPLGVLGSIYMGIASPTEAGITGTVLVILLAAVFYRSLNLPTLKSALLETAIVTSVVMFLIAASYSLSYILTYAGILKAFTNFLLSVSSNIIVTLLLINLLLLFLGCIMDATPIIILLAPTISVALVQLGLHPLHVAAFFLFNVLVGLITPPVGTALFTGCAVGREKVEEVIKDLLPLFACAVATLLLVAYVPEVSLLIPKILGLV